MDSDEELDEELDIDDDIRALRAEAAKAGDLLQVALCDVALATGLTEIAEIPHSQRAPLERLGIVPEHTDADLKARRLCLAAMAEARAAASEAGA